MSQCGCDCSCHEPEGTDAYPGPCEGCCQPGDTCACGKFLEELGYPRSIYPTGHTRDGYVWPEKSDLPK